MATPPPPSLPLTPDQRLALQSRDRYARLTRNLAIGGLIICPAIAILPPRKLDLYTFALGLGFYMSADHLTTQRTGRSIVENLPLPMFLGGQGMEWGEEGKGLPTERAREVQRQLREGREALRRREEEVAGIVEEKAGEEKQSVLKKLWMGEEKEDWKERRLEEERVALEEGKGYGGMILEQVWEVWNWDKKKGKGDGEEPKKEE
ncbi:hypothetical protein P154DRAFT_522230 [Amniculicola lignicola CBS 123094]|uniref:Uncharacterized protein n=1 Tax=Amniculicola lignicola CBS 123094 TaxID=1392246 RepID=A0A6A5WIX5_9PLEO|nr:hypothetical protein P154DRAFT_522230 [Amniculicola lignicola CBS 123094]